MLMAIMCLKTDSACLKKDFIFRGVFLFLFATNVLFRDCNPTKTIPGCHSVNCVCMCEF